MHDQPPAACDRFRRCVAKFVQRRAEEIRATKPIEIKLAGALARYWEAQAREAINS